MSTFKYFLLALLLTLSLASQEESEDDDDCESEDYEDCKGSFEPTLSPTAIPTVSPTTTATTTTMMTTSAATSTQDTSSTSLQLDIRIIRFEADFASVIGDREVLFLSECNSFWVNETIDVTCRHVQSGSVLLTLQGSPANLDRAEALLEETGIDLPSFALLQNEDELTQARTEQSGSSVTSEIWFLLLLFSCGAGCAVVCAYFGRTKCFDDEEGFVSVNDKPKEIHIQHPELRSEAIDIPKPKRAHIGIAVRDGSNANDIGLDDGLGNTPRDPGAEYRKLARDVASFEEGARPTGFSVEEQGDIFKPFTRPGEPSIVEIEIEKPTSGIIRVHKTTSGMIQTDPSGLYVEKVHKTHGILPKQDSDEVEPVQASL